MQIDARDLHGVLVQRDVANEVLGERGVVLSSAVHAHGHRKPFAALDRFRSDDLRRMFLIVARVDLAKFRRELLRLLARGVHSRNAEAQQKEKRCGSGACYWNSNDCCHLVTSDLLIKAPEDIGEPAQEVRAGCRASRDSWWRPPLLLFPGHRSAQTT